MNDHEICEKCGQSTKRPAGFWDGENERGELTGGFTYTCDSQECPIAQKRRAEEEERARRQAAARAANRKEFISAEQFRSTRREARMTLKEAADLAGVTPAELSAYETEREPFPPEIYRGVMTEFLNYIHPEPSEEETE